MDRCQILVTILLVAFLKYERILALPNGAPVGSCVTLRPVHEGTSLQTGATPYSISIASNNYTSGATITVSITGAAFEGIILHARRATGTNTAPVGTWLTPPANTRLLRCTADGDSITHMSTASKSDPTAFTWRAPTEDVGNIRFVAGIAFNFSTYWDSHQSNVLSPAGEFSPGTGSGADRPGFSLIYTAAFSLVLLVANFV